MKKEVKVFLTIFIFLILAGFFTLSAYFSQLYFSEIKEWMGSGILGMAVYVMMLIIATIVAPITVVPLAPVASAQWGWVVAALLIILGETTGSLLAFLIARKYGYPIVKKLVSLERLHNYERLVPEKHVFLGIIAIRLIMPTDLINYAIGILSKIHWTKFTSAIALGIMPYAFLVAYIGGLPFEYLLLIVSTGTLFFIMVILSGFFERKTIRGSFERWWKKRFRSQ